MEKITFRRFISCILIILGIQGWFYKNCIFGEFLKISGRKIFPNFGAPLWRNHWLDRSENFTIVLSAPNYPYDKVSRKLMTKMSQLGRFVMELLYNVSRFQVSLRTYNVTKHKRISGSGYFKSGSLCQREQMVIFTFQKPELVIKKSKFTFISRSIRNVFGVMTQRQLNFSVC